MLYIIILINVYFEQRNRYFFTPGPDVIPETLQQYRLLGEGVKRPTLDDYIVFVQSTGSGARHLPAGSRLLYDQVSYSVQTNA